MADIKIASDSGKLYAGANSDLEIYNNDSHSFIANATEGHSIVLRTRASGGSTADAVTIGADKAVALTGSLSVRTDQNSETSISIQNADTTSTGAGHAELLLKNSNGNVGGLRAHTSNFNTSNSSEADGFTIESYRQILHLVASNDKDIKFWNGTSNNVTFKNGGNVGINSSNPGAKLEVAGDTNLIISELFADADLSGAGWTAMESGWAVTGNELVATSCASGNNAYISTTTVVGKIYQLKFCISDHTAGGVTLFTESHATTYNEEGAHSHTFKADATTELIGFKSAGTTTLDIDLISFYEPKLLGIGSTTPSGLLEIKDASGDSDDVTNFAKAVHILADDGEINNSGDIVGMLCFSGRNSGGTGKPVGIISGMSNSTWNESQPHGWGGLNFKVGSGANLVDRMTMNATGVGIGCTPSAVLQVKSPSSRGTGTGIALERTGGSDLVCDLYETSGGQGELILRDVATTNVHLSGNTATDSFILGDFGIGETAPSAPLEITDTGDGIKTMIKLNNNRGGSQVEADGAGILVEGAIVTNSDATTYGRLICQFDNVTQGQIESSWRFKNYVANNETEVLSIAGGNATFTSSATPTLTLYEDNNSTGNLGEIVFSSKDANNNVTTYASILARKDDVTHNSEDGYLRFYTTYNASAGERMRIDQQGQVGIGDAANGAHLHIFADMDNSSSWGIRLDSTVTSGTAYMQQFRDGADEVCGSITIDTSGNGATYTSGSDYRIKTNVEEMSGSIERLEKIKPYKYNAKKNAEGRKLDGFYAHELAEIIPEAVVGEKDEVDEDGEMIIQGVDYGRITPLLVSALQEAIERIKVLENA